MSDKSTTHSSCDGVHFDEENTSPSSIRGIKLPIEPDSYSESKERTQNIYENIWRIVNVRVGFDFTRKGARSLVVDGFKFTKSRDGLGERIFWRCSRRDCKATAVSVCDRVEHLRAIHTHEPPLAEEFFAEDSMQSEQQVKTLQLPSKQDTFIADSMTSDNFGLPTQSSQEARSSERSIDCERKTNANRLRTVTLNRILNRQVRCPTNKADQSSGDRKMPAPLADSPVRKVVFLQTGEVASSVCKAKHSEHVPNNESSGLDQLAAIATSLSEKTHKKHASEDISVDREPITPLYLLPKQKININEFPHAHTDFVNRQHQDMRGTHTIPVVNTSQKPISSFTVSPVTQSTVDSLTIVPVNPPALEQHIIAEPLLTRVQPTEPTCRSLIMEVPMHQSCQATVAPELSSSLGSCNHHKPTQPTSTGCERIPSYESFMEEIDQIVYHHIQNGVLVKVLETVQQLTDKLNADADPPDVIQKCRAIQACLETVTALKRARYSHSDCDSEQNIILNRHSINAPNTTTRK